MAATHSHTIQGKRVRLTPAQSRMVARIEKGRTCHTRILKVSQSKDGTLRLQTVPRWEVKDTRDALRKGRAYELVILKDGQWGYPGLRNLDGVSHTLESSKVETRRARKPKAEKPEAVQTK